MVGSVLKEVEKKEFPVGRFNKSENTSVMERKKLQEREYIIINKSLSAR